MAAVRVLWYRGIKEYCRGEGPLLAAWNTSWLSLVCPQGWGGKWREGSV